MDVEITVNTYWILFGISVFIGFIMYKELE
jgi:hypothetical protein